MFGELSLNGGKINDQLNVADIYGTTEDVVYTDSLRDCPVRVTLHTRSLIDRICDTARDNRSQIPPVDVAQIADQEKREVNLVIVDGHARIFALRRLGIKKVTARIHRVDNEAEALSLHVRLNVRSSINSLKYYDLYEFLCGSGFKTKEIVKKLWLDELQARLLKVKLGEEARKALEEYLVYLASRYSSVHLPPYVIEALGRIKDQKVQVKAVKMMIQMIPENISELKFSFPSFDQLEIAFSTLRKEESVEHEPLVFSTTDVDRQKDGKNVQDYSDKGVCDIEEAKELIGNVSNKALLKCPHGGKFLVDLKDHTISEIKEDDMMISIEGDSSEPVLMIPPNYARRLGLDSGDRVYFKYVSTPKQLQKLAEAAKDRRQKLLIMSTTEI